MSRVNNILNEFDLDDQVEDSIRRDGGLGAFITIDVERLAEAWRTEGNAPEILPYQQELVERVQTVLEDQTAKVEDSLEASGNEKRQDLNFTLVLYQMDIERVRYSLARYLRIRILKIEKSLYAIFSDLNLRGRLSRKELKFAETLYAMNNTYFEEQIKKKLTDEAQMRYTTDDLINNSMPDLNKYVYFQPKEDMVLIGTEGPRNVPAGSVSLAQYDGQIREKVLEDKVMLI